MTIDNTEMKQNEFNSALGALSNYTPKNRKYIEVRKNLSDNAKNFYEGRKKIIESFKEEIFPLKSDNEFEEQQISKIFNEKQLPIKLTKIDVNELNKLIIKEETDKNRELFKNYFKFQIPSVLLKTL